MGEYMLLIWHDEAASQAADERTVAQTMLAHDEFKRRYSDAMRGGNRLRPSQSAISLRGGLVTDGAFSETKEVLGGYYVIAAADLDEAVAIAQQLPSPFGGVEVRPVWPTDAY